MITQDYLLKRPPHPSPVKVMIDQTVIPTLIDAAAGFEEQIERIGACARRSPLSSVGAAFGLALIASRMLRTTRMHRRRRGARGWLLLR